MITLYVAGPFFGLPDSSPFVTKVDLTLRFSGLEYQTQSADLTKAPKRKLPFIADGDELIGDSVLIRSRLRERYGVDFHRGLTARQKAELWAVERMCDEHLYWMIVYARWLIDSEFEKGPSQFFAAVPESEREAVQTAMRNKVRGDFIATGLGLHSHDEIVALGCEDLAALSVMLGDQPYFYGNEATLADVVIYPFILGILCPLFDNEFRSFAEGTQNLSAYAARMTQCFAAPARG